MISFDDFKKLELRVGRVVEVQRVEGSEKLLKLKVDIGSGPINPPAERAGRHATGIIQLVAGVGLNYSPEEMANRDIIVVVNLEPRQIMGLESQGMLLAAAGGEGPVLLTPDRKVPPGTAIK